MKSKRITILALIALGFGCIGLGLRHIRCDQQAFRESTIFRGRHLCFLLSGKSKFDGRYIGTAELSATPFPSGFFLRCYFKIGMGW